MEFTPAQLTSIIDKSVSQEDDLNRMMKMT